MDLKAQAAKAREALARASFSSGAERDALLRKISSLLELEGDRLLEANSRDLARGRELGMSPALLDRLELTPERIKGLASGVAEVASLPDPLGEVEDYRVLPSGLGVGRMRAPLGLILFICEARPGAVAEAAAMTLKAGNALLVKPGKEAAESTAVLGDLIRRALRESSFPEESVTVLNDVGREDLKKLLALSEIIDLVIPRGGEGLIREVSEHSRIPVLRHFKGVCHLYADRDLDLETAVKLIVNGKANRPGTCNALECLLVHRERAADLFEVLVPELVKAKISVRAHGSAHPFLTGLGDGLLERAGEEDWGREYLELKMAAKVVEDFEEALAHIRRYGSFHTEVIVTRDLVRAREFLRRVDAGCVMVNASPRLNDGGCLGLGGEIGISTTKLHAYGPMGLKELTCRKFVALGSGQIRA